MTFTEVCMKDSMRMIDDIIHVVEKTVHPVIEHFGDVMAKALADQVEG